MGPVQRFVEAYRHLVRDRCSQIALPLSIVLAFAAVALSYLLIYRCSSSQAKRLAKTSLTVMTIISLAIGFYELWYWGEVSFDSIINVVPIAVMDAIAVFKFSRQPRGILQAVLFAVFVAASLAYAATTVLSELIPVNRLEVSGLLAREIVQPGVVADGSRLHFGPWRVEARVSCNVPVRAGKRARG